MSEKALLIDSDIFILLSGAGVLKRAVELLGFDIENVRRLDALPHQLERGRKFRERYSYKVRAKAIEGCKQIASLIERPAQDDVLQRLASVSRIDEGEALMFALMTERDVYILASGDKQAMRTLATTPELADIRSSVAGRVVCLEAVIRLLVRQLGARRTATAFTPLRNSNTTLRVVFSLGEKTPKAQCLAALRSYLNDLKNDVGDDFLLIP